MQALTFEQLMTFVVVLGALIAAYNLISSALKNRREQLDRQNAPMNVLTSRVDRHDQLLDSDKRHLERIDRELEEQRAEYAHYKKGMDLLMRYSLAMTRHARSGNNIDGLERIEQEITLYLTGGKEDTGHE